MSNIILSELQILLRKTHEQVQSVEHAYDEVGASPEQHIVELRKFRQHLFKELSNHGVLPSEPDRDREDLKMLAAKVAAALDASQRRWVTREVSRLLELIADLESSADQLSYSLRNRISEMKSYLDQPQSRKD